MRGGAADIEVRERDLTGRTRVALSEKTDRLALGVLAGWRTNLARVSAPTVSLEALWRTPLLGDRLLVSARVSWYQESATLAPAPGLAARISPTARIFPLCLLAVYQWPFAWGGLHAGAGLGVDVAWFTVGPVSQAAVSPAAALLLGASRRLGPGEALLEVAASAGSMETSLASLRTGGLSLSAGYRLRP